MVTNIIVLLINFTLLFVYDPCPVAILSGAPERCALASIRINTRSNMEISALIASYSTNITSAASLNTNQVGE